MRRLFASIAVLLLLAGLLVSCGSSEVQTTATSVAATTISTAAAVPSLETTSTQAPTTTTASPFYTKYTGTGPKIVDIGASPDDYFILHLTKDVMFAFVEFLDSSG